MKLVYLPIIFALALVLLAVMGQQGCQPAVKECSLSLCDCKCYLKGQTPEELTGKLCGINCEEHYNVIGCVYENGSCKEIYGNSTSN